MSRYDKDYPDRPSLLSATTPVPDGKYIESKTPDGLEGGALRPGGAPDLYSRDNIGLLAQYAAVGVIYGSLPRVVYPFIQIYSQLETHQVMAAYILIPLPWSFKSFMGFLSDCFPILGYRRKPYMFIGWTMCAIFFIIMACFPVTDPYYSVTTDRFVAKGEPMMGTINEDARASAAKYIMMMTMASFGYVLADVAADAMVVEFAQREPDAVRGTTQTTIYLTRTIFMIFSMALVGFCMNGTDYGGQFTWSLNVSQIMWILAAAAIVAVPCTHFLLKEEKTERVVFSEQLSKVWDMLQQRAIWQIMAFKFFSGLFRYWTIPADRKVGEIYAKLEPLNDTIFGIIGNLMMAMTLYVVKQYGLNWDWRRTIAITTVITIVLDAVVSYVTIYDVFRNQWFWVGAPLLEEFPASVNFIIGTYVVVELADEGLEGITYGLITTISNLSIPFAGTLAKQVASNFDAFNKDIALDTPYTRNQIAYTFLIAYIMKVLSLGWLVLLPRQKKETQELKANGGKSKPAAIIALIIFGFALVWVVTTNLLSIFPSTMCLKVAGGKGC